MKKKRKLGRRKRRKQTNQTFACFDLYGILQNSMGLRSFFLVHLTTGLYAVLLLTVGLVFFLFNYFFGLVRVDNEGMEPTFSEGEYLFVQKKTVPRRFQIIYYYDPDGRGKSLGRVVGLPEEVISYHQDVLQINYQPREEPFIALEVQQAASFGKTYTDDFDLKEVTGKHLVPKKSYFVMGDYRPYAIDSRFFGFIQAEEIIGVVRARMW